MNEPEAPQAEARKLLREEAITEAFEILFARLSDIDQQLEAALTWRHETERTIEELREEIAKSYISPLPISLISFNSEPSTFQPKRTEPRSQRPSGRFSKPRW